MLRAFSGGLPRSLRSLAMTLLFYVILNGSEESHRITDRAYTLFTLVVGYFADAQYDVLFLLSLRAERSKLPGGWRSTEYVFRTLSVGYFADAQYDELFIPYRRQRRR